MSVLVLTRFAFFCGYANPFGLISVLRTVLEKHHVVLKVNDATLIAILCRNCHAVVTEKLLAEGIHTSFEPEAHLRIALMLSALAVFLELLVSAVRIWSKQLMEE